MSNITDLPKVALIGCGRWGRNIAKVLARIGSLGVIIDSSAETLKRYGDELAVKV